MAEPKIVDRSYAVADPQTPGNVIRPNGPIANSPGVDGSVNVIIVGSVPVPTVITVTDKSFSPNGADQVIIPANIARINYSIECSADLTLNPNGKSLFINLGAAATMTGNSFEVTPGGYFPPGGIPLYQGAIHCIADASILKTPAKEYT